MFAPVLPVPAVATASAAVATPHPKIVAVYPNPVADEDAGEFVVVSFPRRTNLSGWRISDGENAVELPNETVSGRIAFSTAPNLTENLTSLRALPIAGLSLANSGETVVLRRNGAGDRRTATVDSVAYADAPEGERWRPNGSEWRPLGATERPIVRTDAATVRAFVLPDDPTVPVETLRSADDRILLAGYSFTSRRVARTLVAAANRGVAVRVLVDDAPVGGISRREAAVLDALAERGISVEVIGGERARYAFHHAKYAVVDDRAMVLTENWKPSGTGGRSNRGWGVVVRGAAAAELAEVFEADAGWRDTRSWEAFRRGRSFAPAAPANGSYPGRFEPRVVSVESVTVLTAPDNAERGIVSLLRSANESILVQQMTVGGPRQPFVRATLAAARRGVEVRVLLSGAWYARENNRKVVRWLNERADAEGLPLKAKLVEPRGYEKIHAKGVVVDERHVVVGSLNWNNHSARENREVAVILHGTEAGAYYAEVFRADWKAGGRRVPVGLCGFVAVGVAGAVWLARREVAFG
ncbi:phospholipase D-like domain-containing protein [Haladaptatus salinisoli]|uniref:phospholipase D-like domain-containing protein n=1 Tax=Haladaptatus salinisoli TaxID=2884876 RepID=UPI003F6258DF